MIFWFWLGNLRKNALTNVAIPLARHNLPVLASSVTSNAINKSERKIVKKELPEQEKDLLYLFRMKI